MVERTGVSNPNRRIFATSSYFSSEHGWQQTRPQMRQWCRRRTMVKRVWQSMQSRTCATVSRTD
jgi:hypothetical protein